MNHTDKIIRYPFTTERDKLYDESLLLNLDMQGSVRVLTQSGDTITVRLFMGWCNPLLVRKVFSEGTDNILIHAVYASDFSYP